MMRLWLCDAVRMMVSVIAQMLPAQILSKVCVGRMQFATRDLGVGKVLLKANLLFSLVAKLLLLLLSQELLLLLRGPILGRITPTASCLAGIRKSS